MNPSKLFFKLLYRTLLGGVILFVINLIGGLFDYHIALNVLTAFCVGFLGIPGALLIVILKAFFSV